MGSPRVRYASVSQITLRNGRRAIVAPGCPKLGRGSGSLPVGAKGVKLRILNNTANIGPLRDSCRGAQSPNVRELIGFLAILGWTAAAVVLPLLVCLSRGNDEPRWQ